MAIGVRGMTITESVFSRGAPRSRAYRGARYLTDLHPHVKIELVASEDFARLIEEVLEESVSSGGILVTEILEVTRIRTGDWGIAAI
jgi:nitrogen regulatory protein P-II 1